MMDWRFDDQWRDSWRAIILPKMDRDLCSSSVIFGSYEVDWSWAPQLASEIPVSLRVFDLENAENFGECYQLHC